MWGFVYVRMDVYALCMSVTRLYVRAYIHVCTFPLIIRGSPDQLCGTGFACVPNHLCDFNSVNSNTDRVTYEQLKCMEYQRC